jgi:hypothetical protein
MKTEQLPHPSQSGHDVRGTATLSPPLPDVNSETYPFDLVQYLLDQVAYLSMFAIPDPEHAETATLTPDDPDDWFGLNGGYGIDIRSVLHRFESTVPPSLDMSLKVVQAVGEPAGTLRCRWLFSPDDFEWSPGQSPPPTLFDPWRYQSFVMLDCCFTFGSGQDGFHGYGMGRTFPMTVQGRPQLLAGAVGNLTEGFGKFEGLHGTYVCNGTITPLLGFLGNITCRVEDPESAVRTDKEIPALTSIPDPEPGVTTIVLRGEKRDRTIRTEYGPPPDTDLVTLVTPAQMRTAQFRFTDQGHAGLRSEMKKGQIVGELLATVTLDILAQPGTATTPNFFTTHNVYTFFDGKGQTVGTITAEVVLGRSFDLKFPAAPKQPGMRYGGFGPIVEGTGQFGGIQGLVSVNSAIGVAPHALSMLNMLRIVDPAGKFRLGSNRE